jgi:hypothetical protein
LDAVVEAEHNLMVDNMGGKGSHGVVVNGVDCEHEVDYLFNGEFEDEQVFSEECCYEVAPDWKKEGTIYASENTDIVSERASSQEFGEGNPSNSYLYYPAMVSAGREYYFSGWLRQKESSAGAVYVQLADPTYNTVYTTLKVTSTTWTIYHPKGNQYHLD